MSASSTPSQSHLGYQARDSATSQVSVSRLVGRVAAFHVCAGQRVSRRRDTLSKLRDRAG